MSRILARLGALVVATLLVATLAACSDDGGDSADPTTGDSVEAGGAPETDEVPAYQAMVEALAADELEGRDDGTPGSLLAQDLILEQLAEIAEPLPGAAEGDPYRWTFEDGTNLLGVIPGTDDGGSDGGLADEVVLLGAHYDHEGTDCPSTDPDDQICNGAADNAAGVAAALEVGQAIADEGGLDRTVVLAFWDAEEDGLLGARAYVDDPPIPLDDTVAYVNLDILGANLLPSLRGATILVGAETGGPPLEAAAEAATEAAPDLDTVGLSLLFGQGRSDHAPFAAAGVPVAFFTDANPPCYHTAQDDVDVVDFDKLGQQIAVVDALVRDLATTDEPPVFAEDLPAADHGDAVSMFEVLEGATPDFDRFDDEEQAAAEQFFTDLEAIVEAGEDAFDDEASSTLLGGSVSFVTALATGECDGFLDEGGS